MKNQKFTTREQVKAWLVEMNIENFLIRPDLYVTVEDNVNLSNKSLKFLPVNFHHVYGHFSICNNKLKSMDGFPELVKGHCLAHNNKITSTNGAPILVDGIFGLINNKIKSFDYLPDLVCGEVKLNNNPLPIEQRIETDLNKIKAMAIAAVELALFNEQTAKEATKEHDLFAEFLNNTTLPTAKKYKL